MVRYFFEGFCVRKTRQSYTETGIWGVTYASKNASIILDMFFDAYFFKSNTPAMRYGIQYTVQKHSVNIP